MSKLTRKLTNKCVAAVASLAMAGTLCVAGAVTVSGVAWAGGPPIHQNPSGQQDTNTNLAPWDTKAPQTGSITIFKCDDATSGTGGTNVQTADNGYNKPTACPAGHSPLVATFKVTKVAKVNNETLNYKTESDWAKLADVVNDLNHNDETNITLEANGTTQTTDGTTGKTKFDNLSFGLYKVEETQAPAGYGASDMSVFYITLPLIYQVKDTTDKTGKTYKTAYDYDPAVAPKNKNLTSTLKKVLSTDKGDNFVDVKDDIVYEISTGVNHPSGTLTKDSIKDFAVFDDAPTEAFNFTGNDFVKSVTVGEGKNAVDLTNTKTATYYNVSTQANTGDEAIPNTDTTADKRGLAGKHTRILVKFSDAGLEKIAEALNKAASGSEPQVHVKFKFKLSQTYQEGTVPDAGKKEANGHNKIVNKSGFFKAHIGTTNPDPNPIISGDKDKGTSTNTFGYLQVHKHDKDSSDSTTGLSGAEFKLFNSKDKADACNASLLKKATEKAPAAADPAGDASATADPCKDGASANFNGTTTDGGKFQNAFKALAGQTIYLVEMKAPEGYMRHPGAVAVSLKEGETTTVDFPNTKIQDSGINTPWFFLPKTGAYGILIFAVVGMALIAASVILYVRNRKEEEQQNA
ncbi:cell surface protein [Gardnerella vaginalis]|uniref:Cell surface protein n=1 Tax=Gardnerella vaginalis TaxID=2702 RepID=A0A3E1J0S4_GARVA|nr:SpaH/EbpB family LPXTG-anchored major pilin [Gardnerella vaginalis]RFD79924.1 cell surface protein [Gardnerella vaginalis]